MRNNAAVAATVLVAAQSRHFAEVVAGETLSTKLGPRTTVSEQVSFFPNLSSIGDYRITKDANAVTKLKTDLPVVEKSLEPLKQEEAQIAAKLLELKKAETR